MDIIKDFGLKPELLVAQILNFLIVLYLLKRILYKPILSYLKAREKKIQSGLESAKEGEALLEQALKEEKDILSKAQDQANKIIQDAKKQSRGIILEAQDQAKKQTEAIIREAKEQIAIESNLAEKRLSAYITKASISILEKALLKMVDKKTQEDILTQLVKQIN